MIEKSRRFIRELKIRALKACLEGRFDESRVLILTSSPRSGGTFLGQLLLAIPNSCVLFEPLHLTEVPEAEESSFSWRTYVDPEAKWPEGEAFLKRVFEGKIINAWTAREMSLHQACISTKMIVKFVRANRFLPWICRTFKVPAPILLIRHPCAVIASQLKYGWKNTQRPVLPAYLEKYPLFQAALAKTEGDEENLAATWALDQLPSLLQQRPHPWTTITYEELVIHPEQTLTKIFERWDLDADMNVAMSNLRKPSSVVSRSGISGINGWKKQLSDQQISRILGTVKAFGIDFYSECDEPDYTLLNSAHLTEHIRIAGTGKPATLSG